MSDKSTAPAQVEGLATELLPCPFCGATVEIEPTGRMRKGKRISDSFGLHVEGHYIGFYETEAEAVAAWSTRTDSTKARVEKLEAALREAQRIIEDMRDENKLHGHITDASARYLHHVQPKIDAAIALAESAEQKEVQV